MDIKHRLKWARARFRISHSLKIITAELVGENITRLGRTLDGS